MSSSVLQVPVVGSLVPFDATKAWPQQSRFSAVPTMTARIMYDEETDSWSMVEKDTPDSIVVFIDKLSETTRFLRINRIGRTGKFVNASEF